MLSISLIYLRRRGSYFFKVATFDIAFYQSNLSTIGSTVQCSCLPEDRGRQGSYFFKITTFDIAFYQSNLSTIGDTVQCVQAYQKTEASEDPIFLR